MEDGKTRHVSISLILATQECCPIPGLDDLEAIVKEIGHRQCSLGAPFPIINPSVIDADRPAGRQLQVNRLCAVRSEEHTSELQSLMRISYAVFCLKTKNRQNTLTN